MLGISIFQDFQEGLLLRQLGEVITAWFWLLVNTFAADFADAGVHIMR